MGTSNLTEASRIQLTFVFRAWCLIVEHKASPTFLVGIEMKLRETPEYIYGNISDYSPGDFRQWDRWRKGEYLPSHISFNKLNNNAIKFGWMDKSFGDVLLKVYTARSGLTPNMDACCGWDKLVALSQRAHRRQRLDRADHRHPAIAHQRIVGARAAGEPA